MAAKLRSTLAFEPVEEENIADSKEQVVEEIVTPAVMQSDDDKKPTISLGDLVSAMGSFRDSTKSESAKELRKPEPFTGKDPKKLKAFIFQCQLYFRSSSAFEDDTNKVTFALSYLRDSAQDWFEPGITGQLPESPGWLDNWDEFVDELQQNFGPFDETANVEREISGLRMKDSQRLSEYLV